MRFDKNTGNFWAGILFLVLACLMATSCITQKGFLKYAYDHPDKVAELCAKEFPVVDSVGVPEVDYKPANNTDHRLAIDSIVKEAEKLKEQLARAESGNISDTHLKAIIKDQRNQNDKLLKQVKALQDAYHPCEPDTLSVRLPVYRKSLAEISDLKFKLEKEKEARIKAETERDDNAKEIDKLKKDLKLMHRISAVLSLLVVAGIFIIVKK